MASHRQPKDKSRRINAAPQNIVYNSTGTRRLGVKNRDGSFTALNSNLGQPMGRFHESRADKIIKARADGSFDQKREAYNSASKDTRMDENGDIVAVAKAPTPLNPGSAPADAGSDELMMQTQPPKPMPAAGGEQAPRPGAAGGPAKPSVTPFTDEQVRTINQANSDSKSGITQRSDNEVHFANQRVDKENKPTGQMGTAVIYGERGGDRLLRSSSGMGQFHSDGGRGPSLIDGKPAQEFFSKQAQAQGVGNRFAKVDGTAISPFNKSFAPTPVKPGAAAGASTGLAKTPGVGATPAPAAAAATAATTPIKPLTTPAPQQPAATAPVPKAAPVTATPAVAAAKPVSPPPGTKKPELGALP